MGLGLNLVAYLYYNYCIGTPDQNILSWIVCILQRIRNNLCIGTRIEFGRGSFLLQLLCWDTGLDYFVVGRMHTSAHTEGLILQRIRNNLCIGTQIGFGNGSFLIQLLYWDTGLDYFVADHVHTLADTEQLVYWDSDWIRSRIIFTMITVLGHQIGLFCRGQCAHFSGYGTTCVSGLGLDSVADHCYYDFCIGTLDQIILSRIVCILQQIRNNLCIGTWIGFGHGSFLL